MKASLGLLYRPLLIPAVFYLVVSLLCTQLPLLNYLGYEFSAVIALLATFIAGFSSIKSVRESLRNPQSVIQNPKSEIPTNQSLIPHHFVAFKKPLFSNLLLLTIPFVAMTTNAFFVKNCSLLEGIGFFILIPVASVVFSSALGFFCAVHYKWAKTIFVLIVLATFAEVLAVGYFTPAIFSYNFFYGFFPGLTYDEVLGISLSLILFRILTLILAGVLVWMGLLLLRNTTAADKVWEKGFTLLGVLVQGKNALGTAAIATLIVISWWFRGELGFDSSSTFIQNKLGERIETEHFRIFYSAQSYDGAEIKWIAAEHEFRFKQIAEALSLPLGAKSKILASGKIESYIYPSAEIKHRLMGAGNTNIAKPWSGQIHITKQSLDGTLKHELVHVLAAPFGLPIINASLSTGLVEGLAMAIEWDWGNRTLHQYAASMKKFGVGPDIRTLMSLTGFASQSSSISYVLAGSFCRYLIETYSIRSMMLLYRSNEYEKIYNKSLAQLIEEWKNFLTTIPVGDSDRDAIDVLFRRPPIFKKVCARVVAARNVEAREKLATRDYSSAAKLFEESYNESEGYESLSGYLSSSLRAQKFDVLIGALDSIVLRDKQPMQYLPLFLPIGDAMWASGNEMRAAELYRRVEAANLSEAFTEASILRLQAMKDSADNRFWFSYFLSDQPDSVKLSMLQKEFDNKSAGWMVRYLSGKILFRMYRFNDAREQFESLRIDTIDARLEAVRLKTLGAVLVRLHRFEEAKSAFWNSLNFASSDVAKNEVDEWVERCDFFLRLSWANGVGK